MKIVMCTKCKKYVHNTGKCFYCGSTIGFNDVEMPVIHENAASAYSKVNSLVESKNFSDAIALSHTVIEWMPNLAGIFWLRLLANNRCSNATELVQQGFLCEDDADFNNALAFSIGAEHSIYQDIRNIVLTAQKLLIEEIQNHEYHCKKKTNLLQIHQSMPSEVDTYKNKLFSLWQDLEDTELAMDNLLRDCDLITSEHLTAMRDSLQILSDIKGKKTRTSGCDSDEFHKYCVQIGTSLEQYEQARDSLDSIQKKHPWVLSFYDLEKKRNDLVSQIADILSSLKYYRESVQQTLDEIDNIEQRHRTAITAVKAFNFVDAEKLLGRDCHYSVLHRAGLGNLAQVQQSDTSNNSGDANDSRSTGELPNSNR